MLSGLSAPLAEAVNRARAAAPGGCTELRARRTGSEINDILSQPENYSSETPAGERKSTFVSYTRKDDGLWKFMGAVNHLPFSSEPQPTLGQGPLYELIKAIPITIFTAMAINSRV